MFQKIKEARLAKGMSQKELSRVSGVSRATIIGLERGDVSNTKMDTLRKLAAPLGLTLDEIFFKDDDR
jgi:transcriptional regulator with XRE-family HTH domain